MEIQKHQVLCFHSWRKSTAQSLKLVYMEEQKGETLICSSSGCSACQGSYQYTDATFSITVVKKNKKQKTTLTKKLEGAWGFLPQLGSFTAMQAHLLHNTSDL